MDQPIGEEGRKSIPGGESSESQSLKYNMQYVEAKTKIWVCAAAKSVETCVVQNVAQLWVLWEGAQALWETSTSQKIQDGTDDMLC